MFIKNYLIIIFVLFVFQACYNENYQIENNHQTDTLTIVQWNIGHFSLGKEQNSVINGDNFRQLLCDFNSLINDTKSDIISLNEYSHIFGMDAEGRQHVTEEDLFYKYKYFHVGHQSRYSCNAIFSNIIIDKVSEIEFASNQSATITHTTDFEASDYYFLESVFSFCGKKTKLITAHLAFDLYNSDVAQNQILELLDRYDDDEYVIFCGDWNVFSTDCFNIFKDRGYQLANHGFWGDFLTWGDIWALDNIMVKGFNINHVSVLNTSLSDHKPVIAVLSPKH